MVICQVCGKENPSDVEYCEDCGAALAPAPMPPATPVTPEVGPGSDVAPPDAITGATGPLAEAPASEPAAGSAPPLTGDVVEGEVAGAAAEADTGVAPAPAATPPSAPAPTPSGTGGRPRLIARRYGAETGEEIPLQGDRMVVGRFDPDTGPVDIDLTGIPETPQISRHHAEIYRDEDGQWYVADLGSTNGVFVKAPRATTFGPRITTPTPIPLGGEIAFGNARFVFRMD